MRVRAACFAAVPFPSVIAKRPHGVAGPVGWERESGGDDIGFGCWGKIGFGKGGKIWYNFFSDDAKRTEGLVVRWMGIDVCISCIRRISKGDGD